MKMVMRLPNANAIHAEIQNVLAMVKDVHGAQKIMIKERSC
jgi:hypothetical protein